MILSDLVRAVHLSLPPGQQSVPEAFVQAVVHAGRHAELTAARPQVELPHHLHQISIQTEAAENLRARTGGG